MSKFEYFNVKWSIYDKNDENITFNILKIKIYCIEKVSIHFIIKFLN